MGLFISYASENPTYFFSWILAVVFSICVHEYAHAFSALRNGDSTAADAGHLSLNPLVQMGPISLVMLLLLGIAWGAVPVDVGRMKSRAAASRVAFAGPLANLLLCVAFGLLASAAYMWTDGEPTGSVITYFLELACVANGVLFVFNMLPIPMFDGWSVFALFFPAMRRLSPERARTLSSILLVLIFISGLFSLIWMLGEELAGLVVRGWITVLAGILR